MEGLMSVISSTPSPWTSFRESGSGASLKVYHKSGHYPKKRNVINSPRIGQLSDGNFKEQEVERRSALLRVGDSPQPGHQGSGAVRHLPDLSALGGPDLRRIPHLR